MNWNISRLLELLMLVNLIILGCSLVFRSDYTEPIIGIGIFIYIIYVNQVNNENQRGI